MANPSSCSALIFIHWNFFGSAMYMVLTHARLNGSYTTSKLNACICMAPMCSKTVN